MREELTKLHFPAQLCCSKRVLLKYNQQYNFLKITKVNINKKTKLFVFWKQKYLVKQLGIQKSVALSHSFKEVIDRPAERWR